MRETRSQSKINCLDFGDLCQVKLEVDDQDLKVNAGETQVYEVMMDIVKQRPAFKTEEDDHLQGTILPEYPSTSESKSLDTDPEVCHVTPRRSRRHIMKLPEAGGFLQPCINESRFKCGLCETEFSRLKSLRLHLFSNHSGTCPKGEIKAVICKTCNVYFPIKELLKEHQKHHNGPGIFKCSECPGAFPGKQSLSLHQQYHFIEQTFQCEVCNSTFESKALLRSHERYSHFNVGDSACNICNKSFINKIQLQRHVARMHKVKGLFTCSVCGKTMKGHALSHLRIHWKEKQFKCQFCNMRFVQSSQLQVHMRTHTGAKPYPCQVCGVAFAHSSAQRVHLRIHTGEKPEKCMLCPAAFGQLPHLKKHMRCIHKTDKPYVCVPCMAFFHTKAQLQEHNIRNRCPEIPPLTINPSPILTKS